MKKTLFAISMFAAIIMGGCRPETRNELLGIPENAILLGSESYVSANDAKAYVSEESVYWATGDKLKLNGSGTPYSVTVNSGKAYIDGAALAGSEVYGWTPFDMTGYWTAATRRCQIIFPSSFSCTYDEENKLQEISVPMATYATSVGHTLKFWHLSSAIKVCVRNEMRDTNIKLDRVVVSCSTYKLSGRVTATLNNDGAPTSFEPESTSSEDTVVTVDFTDDPDIPYSVSGDYDEYIAVQVPIRPIGEGSNVDITVKVYAYESGKPTHTFVYTKKAAVPTLSRNKMVSAGCRINRVSGLVEEDNPVSFNPYTTPLTFEATQNSTKITFTKASGSDRSLEYSVNGGAWNIYSSAVTIQAGDKISFRGDNPTMAYKGTIWSNSSLKCSKECYIYGNVMSLLDKDDFADMESLTSDNEYAFYKFFAFSNPISNHDSKELVLPATTLSAHCYDQMFSSCTSLTKAPDLPAETLATGCYYKMFSGCTSISSVKCLATSGNNTTNCENWLYNVAASGTFTKASTATWTTGSASGIPSGWTTVNAN